MPPKALRISRRNFIDLTGKTFGQWTVLSYLGACEWECQCSCGNIRVVNGSNLRSGRSLRCDLCRGRKKQLVGHRFGQLLVIKKAENDTYRNPAGVLTKVTQWWVRCDCGNEKIIKENRLMQGTKSCGKCDYKSRMISLKKRTHGLATKGSPTPEYQMWARAKRRAEAEGLPFDLNPADISIPDMCPVFGWPLKVGNGASHDASPSLDKLDPSKGYVKGNVWVISHLANRIKNNASLEKLQSVTLALQNQLEMKMHKSKENF